MKIKFCIFTFKLWCFSEGNTIFSVDFRNKFVTMRDSWKETPRILAALNRADKLVKSNYELDNINTCRADGDENHFLADILHHTPDPLDNRPESPGMNLYQQMD